MHREAQIPDNFYEVGDFRPFDLSLPTLPLCSLCPLRLIILTHQN